MRRTLHLLTPLACSLRNLARRWPRAATLLALGALALLAGLEQLTQLFLERVMEVPIGRMLAHHLMSMFLFSLQFLLGFSALINALSAYFLSRDLDTWMASPVPLGAVFWAKGTETLLTSAWMVVALLVPVFFAYGWVLGAPPSFFVVALVLSLPLVVTWTALGIAVALVVARVLPVRRTRDLMRFFAVMGAAVLIVIFRLLQPERLVEPGNFEKLASYLVSLHPPGLTRFPSYWLTEVSFSFMRLDFEFLFSEYLLSYLGAAALAVLLARLVFAATYVPALHRFQEAPPPAPRRPGRWVDRLLAPLRRASPEAYALGSKDLKVLTRSPVVWTQVCLMGVITLIYAYNLYLLPVDTLETLSPGLSDLVAFANIGFLGFLLVAAALRFGFPTISMEGEAFLLVHTSPLGMERYFRLKLLLNLVPLLALALFMAGVAHALLTPPWPLLVLQYLDALLLSLAICAMALDFGAGFRDLRATNFAQLPSGPGGIGFLVGSMTLVFLVVAMQAYPFWLFRRATVRGLAASPVELGLAGLLLATSLVLPLVVHRLSSRRAVRSLEGGLE